MNMIRGYTGENPFEMVLDLFCRGMQVRYQGMGITLLADGSVQCQVPSSRRGEAVTESTAQSDFDRAREIIQSLMDSCSRFRELVIGKSIGYLLVDENGPDNVELCSCDSRGIHWSESFTGMR